MADALHSLHEKRRCYERRVELYSRLVFQYPDYLIIHEFHFKGGRADLAVVTASDGRVILVYESKKEGGSVKMLMNAVKQAENVVVKSNPLLLASLGPKYMFYIANSACVKGFHGFLSVDHVIQTLQRSL